MPKKPSAFFTWFTTFNEEKGIELGEYFQNKAGVVLQYGDVIQFIISFMNDEDQAIVKSQIVKIDFRNGDVGHFYRYIGEKMTQDDKNKIDKLIMGVFA